MDNLDLRDVRDRLARSEQDIKNAKENFSSFKSDDFGSLKREVHTMRSELNTKIDDLHDLVSTVKDGMIARTTAINVQLAKYTGGIAVVVFLAEFVMKKFL